MIDYRDPAWVPPWRTTEQAVCVGEHCALREPRLCMKSTMTMGPRGLHCRSCTQRAGLLNDKGPAAAEQLALDIAGP